MKVSSRIARNAGELKLGFQGNISKDLSISAHIGFQKGKENYKRTEAQVVFNYNF